MDLKNYVIGENECNYELYLRDFLNESKYFRKSSMHDAFTIEALKAHIFDPEYTKLITKARLRNSAMLKIVDLMSISRPGNSKERKGRISYSALGINQMGAVYEALLSYSGFIAEKNICIVARTHILLDNYIAGLQREGIKSFEIKANKTDDRSYEGVRIAAMHRVKGLEFDHVFAVAVNKKVLPFGTKDDFEDDLSLEEFRTGEKCLLYVALTRARKSAYVSCYGGLSELIK